MEEYYSAFWSEEEPFEGACGVSGIKDRVEI